MKIKQTRQVRLDELISWAWNNDVKSKRFRSDKCNEVYFDRDKWITFDCACVTQDELFTITEEVEINYENRLDLIAITESGKVENFENRSIQGVLCNCLSVGVEVNFIYLQQENGNLGELIWKDGELVE